MADGAPEGVYSVGFRLLDMNTAQGYTPIRDSGVFYLDFYVVRERLDEWAARGLHVYLLPAYSPQLNLIERCWLES